MNFSFPGEKKTGMNLLRVPENKYDLFNTQYPDIMEFGMKQLRAVWLPNEISYDEDRTHFQELKDDRIKHILKRIIGFFFTSDGIVFANLDENFKEEFKSPDVKFTLGAFEVIERIHAISYGFQLDSIIIDEEEKKSLMNAIVEVESIKKMAEFAFKYMKQETPLYLRIVAFLCIEGIFFSSPFAFIFWIRKYLPKKFPGIVSANDFISKDENLHSEYSAYVINLFRNEGIFEQKEATAIFREATAVALDFVDDTFPDDLLGMTRGMMRTHVKYIANRWAQMIGLPVLHDDARKTPFTFMDNIALGKKDNFFEVKDLTEYQGAPNVNVSFTNPENESF